MCIKPQSSCPVQYQNTYSEINKHIGESSTGYHIKCSKRPSSCHRIAQRHQETHKPQKGMLQLLSSALNSFKQPPVEANTPSISSIKQTPQSQVMAVSKPLEPIVRGPLISSNRISTVRSVKDKRPLPAGHAHVMKVDKVVANTPHSLATQYLIFVQEQQTARLASRP